MNAILAFLVALIGLAPAAYAAEPVFNAKTLSVGGIMLGDGFDKAKKLGHADVFSEGDAGAAADKLCFAFDKGGKIIFQANYEMGDSTIDTIFIQQASFKQEFLDPIERLEHEEKCAKTSLPLKDVSLPFGLKMGMSYEQVMHALGTPEKQTGSGKIKIVQFAQHRALPAASVPENWNVAECGAPEHFDGINAIIDENDHLIGITLWHGGPYC